MNLTRKAPFLLLLIMLFACAEKSNTYLSSVTAVINPFEDVDSIKFNSPIYSIYQDRNGNYWFGSQNDGVCIFDGQSFTYFTTENGLPDNQIRSIQEDLMGNIWFGTANGVARFDGDTMIDYTPFVKDENLIGSKLGETDLWFNAGTKFGFYKYNGKDLEYIAFPNFQTIQTNKVYQVTDIAKGNNNTIWLATYDGVINYDGSNFTLINDENFGYNFNSPYLHVRSVLEDSKGRLWMGNNGVGVLLKENNVYANFSKSQNLTTPNSFGRAEVSPDGTLEHVFCIFEDNKGVIWFGDRDTGAWSYDGKQMTNYKVEQNVDSQMVYDIYLDNHNNLLFAMGKHGMYRFNGKSFDNWL